MKAERKAFFKQISLPLGIFLALCLFFVLGVYFALFKPNFVRIKALPLSVDEKHFETKENLQRNKADSEWFYSQNPDEVTIDSFDGLKLLA